MAYRLGEGPLELRDALVEELCRLSGEDESVVVLDADLSRSSGLFRYRERFPDRFFNCGVQEANMMGVAGGLSSMGFVPVVHSFASFASRRATDQVFVSCLYSRQNVKIIGSDPGICNAANGGTHLAYEDLGIMGSLPGMQIVDFTDAVMIRDVLPQILSAPGTFYMRLFRKTKVQVYLDGERFTLGRAKRVREGRDLTLIAAGAVSIPEALAAAELLSSRGIEAEVVDMFTLKPLDRECVIRQAERTGALMTVDNHNALNGLGAAVADVIARERLNVPFVTLGIPDTCGEVGTVDYLKAKYGIDGQSIVEAAERLMRMKAGQR